MAKKLVSPSQAIVAWQEIPDRSPGRDEVQMRPKFGVEKHGTMAPFMDGFAHERGRWAHGGFLQGRFLANPTPAQKQFFTDEVALHGPGSSAAS